MFNLFLAISMICVWVFVTVKSGHNNRLGGYIGIFYLIIATIMIFNSIFFKIISKVETSVENPVTIEANIQKLSSISSSRKTNSFFILNLSRNGGVKQTYYKRYILYSYIVDGIEYVNSDTIESTARSIIENINTNTIKIKYNAKNPSDSVIEHSNYNIHSSADIINIITIVVFIGMGIFIRMGSTPLKGNNLNQKYHVATHTKSKGKNTSLKILKIDIIDYEREKVFFENKDKEIYYYETDFGEEFNVNEQYEIKLKRYNKEKNRIEYEGNIIKAVKIVNVEKREFIKKE